MSKLTPCLGILPPAQRLLWPRLGPSSALGFALYGGTAIALRLGHRASIDFDFFSNARLDRAALAEAMPFLGMARVIQDRPDTLTYLVAPDPKASHTVKLSFFGSVTFGRVGAPQWTSDDVAQVASLDDLLGTKLKVLLQRVEAKDYVDVSAILESGIDLARGLGAARTLFGPAFQPSECVKSLVYFEGGDLDTLPQHAKTALIAAVKAVDDIPVIPILGNRLTLS